VDEDLTAAAPLCLARDKSMEWVMRHEVFEIEGFVRGARPAVAVLRYADGVKRVLDRPAAPDESWDPMAPDPASSRAPYRLYNIGNNNWVQLERYIEVIEGYLGRTVEKNLLPLQPGDVPDTYADVDDLVRDTGYRPSTTVEEGVRRFLDWYLEYYAR